MSVFPANSSEKIREQVRTGAAAIKEQLDITGCTVAEEAAAVGSAVKEEVATTIKNKAGAVKAGTADTLSRVSVNFSERARESTSTKYQKAMTKVAEELDHASNYIRSRSVADARADVQASVGRHPGRWLLCAAAAGFCAGIAAQNSVRRSRTKA